MVLAVLSASPSQLLRISPNIYPSLPPLPVLSLGESISSASVDVSGGALRRRLDVVFPELGSIAAARLHATIFNGGSLPTPRTSPVVSSFSSSPSSGGPYAGTGSFIHGQQSQVNVNPYATSASALGLPPMPITFPSAHTHTASRGLAPRPLAPGRCGALRVQTQPLGRPFGNPYPMTTARFPITPPPSSESDRLMFTLPAALRASGPVPATPLEEASFTEMEECNVDVEETRFRRLVDSLTDDDLESGLGGVHLHRKGDSMEVDGQRSRSLTVSSSGSLGTIINAFPAPPHSAGIGMSVSTFSPSRAPSSAPPIPFSFNTAFPMGMGVGRNPTMPQIPQARPGAYVLPSPPHSPTHTLVRPSPSTLGYPYFPRQALPLPARPLPTPNFNAKFSPYPLAAPIRPAARAPTSSSSSSSVGSMPQCILTPDGKALASAYGPWRSVEVSPEPVGNSVIISWPSGFGLPL